MIDLHSHILPGIDDGAASLDVAIDMARMWLDEGVTTVACTPHILPAVYANSGPQIEQATTGLRIALAIKGVALNLVAGADNHVVPDLVRGLKEGRLLSLAGSKYVLVEPPHHVCPPRLDRLFFDIFSAGYVPILTHPERLTWIEGNYALIGTLAQSGVLMQITAGSLLGHFGRRARYWAERMLDDGIVDLLASDAHDAQVRRPNLRAGYEAVAHRAGHSLAEQITKILPQNILDDGMARNAGRETHPGTQSLVGV